MKQREKSGPLLFGFTATQNSHITSPLLCSSISFSLPSVQKVQHCTFLLFTPAVMEMLLMTLYPPLNSFIRAHIELAQFRLNTCVDHVSGRNVYIPRHHQHKPFAHEYMHASFCTVIWCSWGEGRHPYFGGEMSL